METRITEQDVQDAIASEEYMTIGKKTTLCLITLKNGFEVVGTSACVDAANYSLDIGKKYARDKAIHNVWSALGAQLQAKLVMEKCCGSQCDAGCAE